MERAETAAGGPAARARVAGDLTLGDLAAALAAGWRDFARAPRFGLFLAAFYALGGAAMAWGLARLGMSWWMLPLAAGFPLFAPFAAVGLYEVSRRIERGEPLTWRGVLGALGGRGDEQLVMVGTLIFVVFAFWLGVAHAVFAVFLGESGMGLGSIQRLATAEGLAMLAVGGAIGAAFAFALYAITVLSIPMMLDRDVDFVTAIVTSLAAIKANPVAMIAWAAIIAIGMGLAMLPAFIGLFVVLPVLAHATWHVYRRAVG